MHLRRSNLPKVLFGVLSLLVLPEWADAQQLARVRLDENFRRDPNGVVLARVTRDSWVEVLEQEGNWTRVVLSGWVWLRSLELSSEPEFELVVSEPGGENLRAEPAGPIVGRLEEGTLLQELERLPAWARVSREGWIWTGSLDLDGLPPVTNSEPALPPARNPEGFETVGGTGGAILASPDGDTLARAIPGTALEMVRREGNWVRVRLEGWMWSPTSGLDPGAVDEAAAPVTPQDVSADADAFRGRVVQWTLQYISLERADAIRSDFFEGEPFILARYGGSEGPFVYVAVPAERLAEVEGLVPLESLSVTGRVRTGRSALTAVPIIDLVTLERR